MLSIAIIHAPVSRERGANVRLLRAQIPNAVVVSDEDGEGAAFRSFGNRWGCWPVARRGWEAFDRASTHHIVLEDDAMLCDGFMDRCAEAISQAPDAVISLFRGSRDCSVGTSMPVSAIGPWLEWSELAWDAAALFPHHDYMITHGARELGIRHLYTVPSLVDQRPLPSLLAHDHISALRFEASPTSVTLET